MDERARDPHGDDLDVPGNDEDERHGDEDEVPGEGEDELPTDVMADPDTRIEPDLRPEFDIVRDLDKE